MPPTPLRAVLPAVLASCALTAAAAEGPRPRSDAIDASDPRAAFVWTYLCAGRAPFVDEHQVRRCPCPDRATGAPGKDAPAAYGGLVNAVYLGSFTRPQAEQAVVTLFECMSFERTTLLLLEKKGGQWAKVAYKALSEAEEDENPTRDSLPPTPLNDGLVGDCTTWLDRGTTRFVCEGGAALYVHPRKGTTLYGIGALYDVSLDDDGTEISGEPLLRFIDNTHSDCDLMPMRHRADVASWAVDAKGKVPRLTVRLDLGDGKATQHGDTKACYADVPATRHVALDFDWKDGAWSAAPASAAVIAGLEKIAAEFDRMK